MTDAVAASIHASAVMVGPCAVLIRGPSGAGKSRLAFELILAGRAGCIPPAVLIGDDRIHLDASGRQLVVRPVQVLAGLIEIRGLGLRRCPFAETGIVGLVVDLSAADAERLPPAPALQTIICGVEIPRIPVGAGFAALPLVAAALTTTAYSDFPSLAHNCTKGIGNHMRPSIATE